MAGEPEKPPKQWKRRLIHAGTGIAIFLAIAGIALLTGIPQDRLAEWLAGRSLGAVVSIDGLSFVPAIRSATIRVFDGPVERARGDAVLTISGLTLDYRLWPERGRWFPVLTIDTLTLNADSSNLADTNYDFLNVLVAQPSSGADPTPYLPESIVIGNVESTIRAPEAFVAIKEIPVQAAFRSLADFQVTIHADSVLGEGWAGAQQTGYAFDDGTIDLVLARSPSGFRAEPFRIHLPNLVDLDCTAQIELAAILATARIEAAALTIEGVRLGPILDPLTPIPVSFTHADFSKSTVAGMISPLGVTLSEASVSGVIESLQAGESGSLLYNGDVRIAGTGKGDSASLDITLGQGQVLHLEASGSANAATIALTMDQWPRAAIAGVIPENYRYALEYAARLAGMTASCSLEWNAPEWKLSAEASPSFADCRESMTLVVNGVGTWDNELEGASKVVWQHGGGRAIADVAIDPDGPIAATVSLESVDLAQWTPLFIEDAPFPVHGIVNGQASIKAGSAIAGDATLEVSGLGVNKDGACALKGTFASTQSGSPAPLALDGALTLSSAGASRGEASVSGTALSPDGGFAFQATLRDFDVRYAASLAGTWPLPEEWEARLTGAVRADGDVSGMVLAAGAEGTPLAIHGNMVEGDAPITVAGTLQGDASGHWSGTALDIGLGDGGHATITEWAADTAQSAYAGDVEGSIELAAIAPLLKVSPFSGTVGFAKNRVTFKEGVLRTQLDVTGQNLAYEGVFAMPSGVELAATGEMIFAVNEGVCTLAPFSVTWPPGTTLGSEEVRIVLDPQTVSGPIALKTDLLPLVDLGYIEEAQGLCEAKGRFAFAAAGLEGAADVSIAAPTLVLPDKALALAGVSLHGAIEAEEGVFTGVGALGAAQLLAAGGVMEELRGQFTIGEGMIRYDGAQGTLYAGTATLEKARLEFLEDGFGALLDVHLSGVDLDQFTRDYKLTNPKLTGRARGRAVVEWSGQDFGNIELALLAGEGFSVNRDFVKQLLLSEYMQGYTGAKTLDKITRGVIGEAEQRAFDEGTLSLRREGGGLRGKALLTSTQLTMTVNLNVDWEEVVRALEFHQESRLSDLEGIEAEPLKWSE